MSFKTQMIRLDEIAKINPARKVLKGKKVDFVDMAALPQNSRDIIKGNVDQRIAKGAGAHFRNYDTLLARITPCLENGKTAQVRCLEDDAIAEGSTEFIVLCGIDEKDNDFIYYLCRDSEFRKYAIGRMEGTSGRQRVSWQSIAAYQFQCPEQAVRVRNSKVLTLLDDRITLLRETNLTLEAIAQALFKSWFVDFEPVRAKKEGRKPEGMDAETAALFPDRFQQSELCEIPKGWTSNVIKELINRPNISKRFTKAQVLRYGAIPVYEQGVSILLGYHNDVPTCNASPENPMFIFGDHTCVTKLSCQPFDISQNVILLNGSMRNTIWTYYAIQGKQKFEEYRRHWMELIVKNVVVPSIPICNRFAEIVLPLQLKIEANEKTIQLLSNLRDTLLPRLISGQIRLPDAAEKI